MAMCSPVLGHKTHRDTDSGWEASRSSAGENSEASFPSGSGWRMKFCWKNSGDTHPFSPTLPYLSWLLVIAACVCWIYLHDCWYGKASCEITSISLAIKSLWSLQVVGVRSPFPSCLSARCHLKLLEASPVLARGQNKTFQNRNWQWKSL